MSKKIKIPVGYRMKPVSDLKVGNVIYIEGKVVEVYTIPEEEQWRDAETGLIYLDTTVTYRVQLYKDGEVVEMQRPSSEKVQVLQYATVKN